MRMTPAFGTIVPFYILIRGFNLLDTVEALIIVYMVFSLPLTVWLLYAYFRGIPSDFEEAAMVDGCSRIGAIFRVFLPLSKPGAVVTAVLSFTFSWNEFLFAFILTSQKAATVTVSVFARAGEYLPNFWTDLSSISTVAMIPAIVVVIVAQKYIVTGLTMGGVKG